MGGKRLGMCCLLVAALPGCQSEGVAFPRAPEEMLQAPEAIQSGKEIYEKNCAICHGPEGHGDGPQARSLRPPPSDLRNLRGPRAQPGYWFFRIREGGKAKPLARLRSAMPSWSEHLRDPEIWQVVVYLKALVEGGG